jgi:NAD(P)-dependent dehydrogenase (short-subunit alcohol dehydrogenase family)
LSRAEIFKSGNVGVVTGAALGIGLAMCKRFAQAGMSVIMADLPGSDLDAAVEAVRFLSPAGNRAVLAVPTDVSDPQHVRRLHDIAIATFGKVSVLANNAVTRVGRGMDADLADWRRAMEVNVWGPIQTVREFLPDMLSSPYPGIIVNVGSKQGITNPPGHPIYNITKAALKSYTETLEHELRSNPANQGEGRVSAHLLVPGWTTTGKSEHKMGAWLPEQVVEVMLSAIERGDFYIVCPDDEVTPDMDKKRILWAAGDITENRPPLSRWHSDYAAIAKSNCS